MKKQDQDYIIAFNDFFSNKIDGNKLMQTKNGGSFEAISVFEATNKKNNDSHINGTFYPRANKIDETGYNDTCELRLHNISNTLLKELFNNKNYNYSLIEDIINELFNIGKSFGFYKEMTPINNIRIEEQFDNRAYERRINTKNITKLTLASFLTDKFNDSNPKKKVAKVYMRFLVSDENELHPVLTLFLPYSVSYDFVVNLQLHPSKKNEQLIAFEDIKKNFKIKLEEQLNSVLKRNLKIKKEEIDDMTLQNKLNYIPVIEMNRI